MMQEMFKFCWLEQKLDMELSFASHLIMSSVERELHLFKFITEGCDVYIGTGARTHSTGLASQS